MTVLAVASGKGGVGKTTTAVSLAAIWADAGARVLLIDADPQGSASAWLGVSAAAGGSLIDVLEGKAALRALVARSDAFGVDVVPASPALAAAERVLSAQPLAALGLRRAIAAEGGPWAWVLIDCPPSLGLLTTAAIAASSAVLAPVEPSALGLVGLADLMTLVDGVGAHVSPAPFVAAVLACRVDGRQRLARAMLDTLRTRWPALVMAATIRETTRAREAAAARQPLTRWDPNGAIVADYRAAAAEIARRLHDEHK